MPVKCCWKEVAPLLLLIPADTFVVSHVGLALGLASYRGSYRRVDLFVHSSGMPRHMVRTDARMLTCYAHEWPDKKLVMGPPLAWAMEAVKRPGYLLSLTAQDLGMSAWIRRSESLQRYFCGDSGSSGW